MGTVALEAAEDLAVGLAVGASTGGVCLGALVGPQPRAGIGQIGDAQAPQRASDLPGSCRKQPFELVDRAGACLSSRTPRGTQHSDRLHRPARGLRAAGRLAPQHRPRRHCVSRVVVVTASAPACGTQRLNGRHALTGHRARQAGTVAAGALHADTLHVAQAAQPPQQLPIVGACRRERRRPKHPSRRVECRVECRGSVPVAGRAPPRR